MKYNLSLRRLSSFSEHVTGMKIKKGKDMVKMLKLAVLHIVCNNVCEHFNSRNGEIHRSAYSLQCCPSTIQFSKWRNSPFCIHPAVCTTAIAVAVVYMCMCILHCHYDI